jgi:hypothetical protein
MSEKGVQTAKRLLMKATKSKSDPYLALLEYRNTPVDGFSPAQVMIGRQLRSLLPSITQSLQPEVIHFDRFRQQRKKAQEAQSKFYNRYARSGKPLKSGEKMGFQLTDQGPWKKATVLKPMLRLVHTMFISKEEGHFAATEFTLNQDKNRL